MSGGSKPGRKHQSALRRAERERAVGLDSEDDAARWLAEHDPPAEPEPPKSARKSKALHQFRRSNSDKLRP